MKLCHWFFVVSLLAMPLGAEADLQSTTDPVYIEAYLSAGFQAQSTPQVAAQTWAKRIVAALALDGKTTVYLTPGPALYLGDFQAGNYRTAGLNKFDTANPRFSEPVVYLAQYEKYLLKTVYLSTADSIVIQGYTDGHPSEFMDFIKTEGEKREQTQYYEKGVLARSHIRLHDFGDMELDFYNQGDLIPSAYDTLRNAAKVNCTYRELTDGFELRNQAGQSLRFSPKGRVTRTVDSHGAEQHLVEYDLTQNLTFNFVKFQALEGEIVTITDIEKVVVRVWLKPDGTAIRNTTLSSRWFELNADITENITHHQILLVNGEPIGSQLTVVQWDQMKRYEAIERRSKDAKALASIYLTLALNDPKQYLPLANSYTARCDDRPLSFRAALAQANFDASGSNFRQAKKAYQQLLTQLRDFQPKLAAPLALQVVKSLVAQQPNLDPKRQLLRRALNLAKQLYSQVPEEDFRKQGLAEISAIKP
jgi:hypothetical protein